MKTTSLGAVRAIAGRSSGGYIAAVAVVFMAIFLTVSTAMVNSVSSYSKAQQVTTASTQALQIAEAGIDKAFYALNNQTGYTGETATPFGEGEFTVSIASVGSDSRIITSTGYVPNAANPISTRTVKAKANVGNSVISFQYAVQAGSGGFEMSGSSRVEGSIYSNGSIISSGGTITGSATAANPPATTTDQANESPIPPPYPNSLVFSNANPTQDFAQSFQVSSAQVPTAIDLYIKKTGNPGDRSVYIVTDNGGNPASFSTASNRLAQGTLQTSKVVTSYGWVSIPLSSSPPNVLVPGQTYWLVIDGGTSGSYTLGANSGGYVNGEAKIGRNGSTWAGTTPSGLDSYFRIYLGGGASMIGGGGWTGSIRIGSTPQDEAWAQTVQGAEVSGPLYCQTGSINNKACNTSRPAPTPQPMPLSDANIDAWKAEALSGGVHNGDFIVGGSTQTSLGNKKITGNLTVGNSGKLTLEGPLWVEGNVTVDGSGEVRLSSDHGSDSGVIVSDGYINVGGSGKFFGSGQAGSYVFLVTTSACPVAAGCGANNAVSLSGSANAVAIIAQNGTASVVGSGQLKQLTAQRIVMSGSATLVYDSGLISETFHSSGPGGSWQFVPGSYVIVQ